MLQLIALCLSVWCADTACHTGRVLIFSEEFERITDGNGNVIRAEEKIPRSDEPTVFFTYNFSQSSFIENNQANTVTTPPAPEPTYIPPKQQTFTEQLREQASEYLWNPLAIGALACGAYALYYVKSKFSLYNLGKACIEKAVWSLWKNKKTGNDLDEQDTDTALLIQILHAYDTDNYTTAVARFLQDVEEETELLTAYISEAKSSQEGLLRFMFEDLSAQIKEAQERLATLEKLKAIVMRWLQPKREIALEETLAF